MTLGNRVPGRISGLGVEIGCSDQLQHPKHSPYPVRISNIAVFASSPASFASSPTPTWFSEAAKASWGSFFLLASLFR